MKAILTLIIVLLFGALAIAQEQKVPQVISMPAHATIHTGVIQGAHGKALPESKDTLARLYRFRNSKVYKELTFSTKANSPKLA